VERRYDFQELFSDYSRAGKIAFHGEGFERRMAVADMEGNQIAIINVESGQSVAAVTPLATVPGQSLKAIFGLAFSNSGELYVSDWELNQIHVFDRQGAHVRWFGRSGTEQGQFRHVRGLCFRNDGNLVVADSGNDRVQIIREDGTFVRAFGSRGSGDGMLDQPMDVCSRPDGSIAVLDNGNHRVVVFDRNGVFLRNIGSRGEGPGEFRFPCFVAAGKNGEIIVGDWWRNNVQIFSPEGEVLQVIGPEGDSIVQWPGQDFDDECDFAGFADADGRLFILDCMSVVVLSSDSSKS
jgi:DNA-binding beta-propeller fold protein YncE